MSNNTFPCRSSSLPPPSNVDVGENHKRRAASDPQHLSVPEPFQSIPAQELLKDNYCGKCGWIRKEGGSIKTWRDRYVILHKGCLYYYYKPEATTTAGKFSLSGYRLSPAPEKSAKFTWTFKLAHIQPEKRTYYFAAYSEREMNEWMENITKEMEEYCSIEKQSIPELSEPLDGPEYCYPEVEPRFDPEEIAVLFGKASPSFPRKPVNEPMYCPPPEFDSKDMVPKKSPILKPRQPGFRKESEFPKGCSLPLQFTTTRPVTPAGNTLTSRPINAFPGLSPVLPQSPGQSAAAPCAPSRPAKPSAVDLSPSLPLKAKPKPLPRPPPVQKKPMDPISWYGTHPGGEEEEEYTEGYLDLVPDTAPADVASKETKATISRSVTEGYPDGHSFKRRQNAREDGRPSCVPLDVDKNEVTRLLENKLGYYILRKSENATSKRALSVWTGDRVRHYLIFYDEEKGYTLDPKDVLAIFFEKLEHLLSHYHKNYLPNCDVKLVRQFNI
ncbi:SH3 domain-binding protein 2-like isoform X1 [Montipora foliosa]|uniref:SH3 domain-binding protein 2-like isoform X1 n=1 Tax=Montipora foliosa TaxID=591990 RepID=UPI0035F191E0